MYAVTEIELNVCAATQRKKHRSESINNSRVTLTNYLTMCGFILYSVSGKVNRIVFCCQSLNEIRWRSIHTIDTRLVHCVRDEQITA